MNPSTPVLTINQTLATITTRLGISMCALLVTVLPVMAEESERIEPPTAELDAIVLKGVHPIETLPVDIPLLVRLTTERNLDIAIAGTQVEQARGFLNQSIAGLFPSIRTSTSVEQFSGGEIFIGATPFSVDRVTYMPRLSVDHQIPLGGKVIYQIAATRYQLQRVNSARFKTAQQALLETLTQYFILLRDEASVAIARQSLREAEAQVDFYDARYRAGFATLLEVMQSKTLQIERKNEVLQSETNREISAITLGAMLDLPLTLKVEPDANHVTPISLVDEDQDLVQLYEAAIQNRPDIRELEFAIREARARHGITRSNLFPTLTLSAYIRGVGPNVGALQQSTQVFSNISLDILRNLGWGPISEMQVSRAKIQEALLNKEKQLNEVQKNLAQAYQNCHLYRAQQGVAEEKLKTATEAYRIAGARVKTGVGINLDLIEAQKELTKARQEYQTAIMNYNIAQLKLLFETGQLTPQSILFALKGSTLTPLQGTTP